MGLMISKGEVITRFMDRWALQEIMLGGQFRFGGFSPYNTHTAFYYGYPLISAGEVITNDEDGKELVRVMLGDPSENVNLTD